MLIGEVVTKSELSKDTIRYYETRGLIDTPTRRDNNYKEYAQDTLTKLSFIRTMKELGFTLKDIAELIQLFESDQATCANVGPTIQKHINEIDQKIQQLTDMRQKLQAYFQACRDTPNTIDCTPITAPLNGR